MKSVQMMRSETVLNCMTKCLQYFHVSLKISKGLSSLHTHSSDHAHYLLLILKNLIVTLNLSFSLFTTICSQVVKEMLPTLILFQTSVLLC